MSNIFLFFLFSLSLDCSSKYYAGYHIDFDIWLRYLSLLVLKLLIGHCIENISPTDILYTGRWWRQVIHNVDTFSFLRADVNCWLVGWCLVLSMETSFVLFYMVIKSLFLSSSSSSSFFSCSFFLLLLCSSSFFFFSSASCREGYDLLNVF